MIEFTKTPAGQTVISSSDGQITILQEKGVTRILSLTGAWEPLLPIVVGFPAVLTYHRADCPDNVARLLASVGFRVYTGEDRVVYFRRG